jgi:hypothetical protein
VGLESWAIIMVRGTALASLESRNAEGGQLDFVDLSSSTGRMFARESAGSRAAQRARAEESTCRRANGVRLAAGLSIPLGFFVVVAAAPDVKRSVVLIFSEDPLAAALIGAAVELVGFEPAFPTDGELPRDALLRERPGLVLVDCDHDAACAPSFFGPAQMTGARVMLVGSRRTRRDAADVASRFGLRAITLPADLHTVADLLRAELEAAGR